MLDTLERSVYSLEDDFMAALRAGPTQVSAFCDHLNIIREQLSSASREGSLQPHVSEAARRSIAFVLAQSEIALRHDQGADALVRPSSPVDGEPTLQSASASASLPLFRYFLSNLCYPYPDSEQKEQLATEVSDMGWRDFDKKKVEDWLNRRRHQCGYIAILRGYCGDDHAAMRNLCRVALFGSAEEQGGLPDGALDDIEDMRDLVQSQLDEVDEHRDVSWVDSLTASVEAVLAHHQPSEASSWGTLSSDEYGSSDEDGSSDYSSTDVDDEEDWHDDASDDQAPSCVIGAKRKLTECPSDFSSASLRPLSRSPSIASSASSSSTACSLRSPSGASVSSATSDEDDTCGRPLKRCRLEPDCASVQPEPLPLNHSLNSPAHNALFTRYRTKRKRADNEIRSRSRSIKWSRYASLGVASQTSGVSSAHRSALSGLCSLDWEPAEALASDLDVNSFSVDCTQPDGDEIEDDDLASLERGDPDISTWSKLQIFAIIRTVLSASESPLPASLLHPSTYTFDVDIFGAHDAIDLQETLKLTPEALSAMFDAMNGLTPAPAEVIAAASSDDALLCVETPAFTQDVSVPTPDVPAPALDVPAPAPELAAFAPGDSASALNGSTLALDGLETAVPVLSVDSSEATVDAPASEDSLSLPEESLSPTSSSSSDSEGDSPPALSDDDSGSSSRSSSVESDSERDSLLMSPGALYADYSRLNEALTTGKSSNADPSQFEVELGVVPEVTIVDESSCASVLLERYLNDQMTWA